MAVRRHDVRVFIEGVRVPTLSVNISAGVNSASTCIIQIPAVNESLDIPSRAYIQVFFRDFFDRTSEDDLDLYRLLWDGEFRKRRLVRSPTGWAAEIHAEDLTNHWNFAYGIFEPGISEGANALTMMGVQGVEEQNVQALILGSKVITSKRSGILSAVNVEDNAVERAAETYMTDALKFTPFLRVTNRRLKMVAFNDVKQNFLDLRTRLRVVPDREVNILVQAHLMDEMMNKPLVQSPSYMTIRQIMAQYTELFFYQSWPVIAPPYREAAAAKPTIEAAASPVTTDPTERTYLTQVVLKPTTFFSAPPTCNVIWPDDVQSIHYEQDTWMEPTRLRMITMPMSMEVTAKLFDSILSANYHAYAPRLLGKILALTVAGRSLAEGEGGQLLAGKALTLDPANKTYSIDEDIIKAQIEQAVRDHAGSVLDDGDLESDLIKRFAQTSALGGSLILSDPTLPPESREDFKGVIPVEIPLTNYAWTATFSGPEADRQADYIRRVADYYLVLKQYERATHLSTTWNPYLLLGFPCVVLDQTYPLFGEISSIQHSITAKAATTSFSMSYSRTEDAIRYVHPDDREAWGEPKKESEFTKGPNGEALLSRTEPNRDVPFWINVAYQPEYVGESEFTAPQWSIDGDGKIVRDDEGNPVPDPSPATRQGAYPELFGVKSLFQPLSDPDNPERLIPPGIEEIEDSSGKGTGEYIGLKYNQLDAAKLLLKNRNRIKNDRARESFMDGWRQRRVASMREALKFIGAKLINPDLLGNDDDEPSIRRPFRTEVQDAVKAMVKAIEEQGRGGAGPTS